MEPELINGNVTADCPHCGARSNFEARPPEGSDFGAISIQARITHANAVYKQVVHRLLRCSTCGRPGVATVLVKDSYASLDSCLQHFWPGALPKATLPDETPQGVVNEFREAETCMSAAAWRAAAALLRSALEKTLLENGYKESNLYKKIEAAAGDGVITAARRKKADDLVRLLGNDVLHDAWRAVEQNEVEAAHHYVARVIEDFYDDRPSAVQVLTSAGRIPPSLDA